ncbi:MAG: hypothetical protein WCS65_11155, partial [Verrucomicrobiae bacterium]
MSSIIYLDNNATTRVAPEVVEAMLPWLGEGGYGNPSSGYVAVTSSSSMNSSCSTNSIRRSSTTVRAISRSPRGSWRMHA